MLIVEIKVTTSLVKVVCSCYLGIDMKKRDTFSSNPCSGCFDGSSHTLGCRFYGTSIRLSKETWEALGGWVPTRAVQRRIERVLCKLQGKPCRPVLEAPNGPGYWCNAGEGWMSVDTATADLCDKYPEKTSTTRITSEEF